LTRRLDILDLCFVCLAHQYPPILLIHCLKIDFGITPGTPFVPLTICVMVDGAARGHVRILARDPWKPLDDDLDGDVRPRGSAGGSRRHVALLTSAPVQSSPGEFRTGE
jgi:hypothetical protein